MGRREGLKPGSRALITGGSSGLGLALAHELLQRQLAVTLIARREEQLLAAATELRHQHPDGQVQTAALDVTATRDVEAWFSALSVDDRPHVLINSAGILREGYFSQLPLEAFRDVLEINLLGAITVTQAALPSLRATQGRVVNIASVAGLMGVYGYTSYAAAKHGLVGFTNSLRYELEPLGVGVQLVCPGEFDSPMVAALDEHRTPENRAHTLTIPKRSVAAVARDTVRGIERGRALIVPGRQTAAAVLGARLAPAIGSAVARRRIAAAGR